MALKIGQLINSDDSLLNKIANNDEQALFMLYQRYQKPIFLYTLSLLKDYQLAEDAAHDAFIAINKYAASYQAGSNSKAWIFTITRNAAYKIIKGRSNEIAMENEKMDFIINQQNYTASTNPEFVSKAMRGLSDIEAEIVDLYIYGGLKHTEIAKVLKLDYDKVRSTYAYALKKMRKNVNKEDYYD